MIPSPLQRTDATAQGIPAATVQKQIAINTTRAPETNRAHKVSAEAPKAVVLESAERIDFDISISTETMQLDMSGSANFSVAAESFNLDISFAYFNVIIVSGPYTDPLFSGSGDVSMPMTRGEFAIMVSPGTRSGGQGYLAAVRKLAVQLSSLAAGSHRPAPQPRSSRGEAPEVPKVEIVSPTPSGDASMAAASVAASATTRPVDVAGAISAAASRMNTKGDVTRNNATFLATTVASFSSLMNARQETSRSGDSTMNVSRDRLHLRIEESDLTAKVNVERITMDEEAVTSAGKWVDETA